MFGGPVSNELFSGRENEILRIVGKLGQMQHVSIVGERRIGKTSLLHYLSDHSEMKKRGFNSDEHTFIYFIFDGLSHITPLEFWKRIMELLARTCVDEQLSRQIQSIQQAERSDPFVIEDLFINFKKQGQKIVFLFDEFEYATQSENFVPDFFGRLRSLATHLNTELAFVTCSRLELTKVSRPEILNSRLSSPFFNIFETIILKPFNKEEARQLINKGCAKASLPFEEDEIESLIELTGCHPFFLQMGCSYLYDAYTIANLVGVGNRQRRIQVVEEKCEEQAKPHFEYYWTRSSDDDRIVLTISAILSAQPTQERFDTDDLENYYRGASYTVQELESRGLVLEQNGQYRIFSPMFTDWIISEVINKNPTQQSFDEWQRTAAVTGMPRKVRGALNRIRKAKNWEMIVSLVSKVDNILELLNLLSSL
jgi:eukaryotic-like serine/threonine-protein kinase